MSGGATPDERDALLASFTLAIARVNAAGAAWLSDQLRRLSPASLATAFALVSRKLGEAPTDVTVPHLPTPEAGWDMALCARLVLLQRLVMQEPLPVQRRLIADLFYKGDSAERCAILRSLPLLDEPHEYALIATDGVRSHVQPVFEAIACENPYPERHLDDVAFNQLVMKSYFTGVPVRRILGLQGRLNPELRRMALDFEAERKAAGRAVPDDLFRVTSL